MNLIFYGAIALIPLTWYAIGIVVSMMTDRFSKMRNALFIFSYVIILTLLMAIPKYFADQHYDPSNIRALEKETLEHCATYPANITNRNDGNDRYNCNRAVFIRRLVNRDLTPEFCGSDAIVQQEDGSDCWRILASMNNDPSLCNKIPDRSTADRCLESYADSNNSPIVCKEIQSKEIQKYCIISFSPTLADIKLCTGEKLDKDALIECPNIIKAAIYAAKTPVDSSVCAGLKSDLNYICTQAVNGDFNGWISRTEFQKEMNH